MPRRSPKTSKEIISERNVCFNPSDHSQTLSRGLLHERSATPDRPRVPASSNTPSLVTILKFDETSNPPSNVWVVLSCL